MSVSCQQRATDISSCCRLGLKLCESQVCSLKSMVFVLVRTTYKPTVLVASSAAFRAF